MWIDQKVSDVGLSGTGLPLVEPEQVCQACNVTGTVGRVVITSRDATRQEIHRFCIRCWPEECARYEARWKNRRPNSFQALMDADNEMPADQVALPLFEQDPMIVGMGFESATWHAAANRLEKFTELLQMVRLGRVPSEAELVELALEMARELETQIDSRVGPIPPEVGEFLLEFGGDSDLAKIARHQTKNPVDASRDNRERTDAHKAITEAKFLRRSQALDIEIAAAHASADAVIADFDKALESLSVPVTPESRAIVEKELVEMLQHLEQEIATEAIELASWQSEMQRAAKSGDAYTAAKLTRVGDDRMLRLHDLHKTIADVEHLHARLLGDQ